MGIARAEVLIEERQRLEEWLRRGFYGEMPYMARDPEQRTNLQEIFPDARSVVVVTMNYYTPHQHVEDGNVRRVSRYAWGDDYHEVVGERLRELRNWIKQQWPEADGKVCVDISPSWTRHGRCERGLAGWGNTRT